jgi:hypothetical protein
LGIASSSRTAGEAKTPWVVALVGAAAAIWMSLWIVGSLFAFVLDSTSCPSPGCSERRTLVAWLVVGLDLVWLFALPFTWIRPSRMVQAWGLVLALLLPALTWYLLVGLLYPSSGGSLQSVPPIVDVSWLIWQDVSFLADLLWPFNG